MLKNQLIELDNKIRELAHVIAPHIMTHAHFNYWAPDEAYIELNFVAYYCGDRDGRTYHLSWDAIDTTPEAFLEKFLADRKAALEAANKLAAKKRERRARKEADLQRRRDLEKLAELKAKYGDV